MNRPRRPSPPASDAGNAPPAAGLRTGEGHAPGVYVHVPFCLRICPYCDFAVTPLGRASVGRFERYRAALRREIELRATPLDADTVYFGGGTPSCAPPKFFAEMVSSLVARNLAVPSPFVVLEANPEDLTRDPGLARRWVREGVSGVSVGAQALDDRRLRFLGRAHTSSDVRTAASRLADAGIPWISLDFIYGTAGQSAGALRAELAAAASLPGITHFSAYELTVEPRTSFGRRASRGERLRATGAEDGELVRVVHATLPEYGLAAYEASNFAGAPEHRSRHNQKYWTGAPYIGFGPSAHSFAPERAERSWNHRGVEAWRAAVERGAPPTAGRETLEPRERALEELFLRLRTTAGLSLDSFASRFGKPVLEANRMRFVRWEALGLVRRREREGAAWLEPTVSGLACADTLARETDLAAVRPAA